MKPLRTTIAIDEPLAGTLSIEQQAHLLLIAREAVSNAVRHGQANHIRLDLRRNAEHVEFSIQDDGCGFDPAALNGQGLGLKNLADRARLLKGELTISSQPGQGTQVQLTFHQPISP
jgi:two-component system CheB/CheR fusion protein